MSTKYLHPHDAKSQDPERLAELQKVDRKEATGTVTGPNGTELTWTVSAAFDPQGPRWPHVESHLWGMFPILAIENGGYNDLEAQDPYTGRTIHLRAYDGEENIYGALRRLIDAMEAANFLPEDDSRDPGPQGAVAAPDGLTA